MSEKDIWECKTCGKGFSSKNVCLRHEEKCDYSPKTHIKEYKRKCKECGKVWHSLASREKEIESTKSTAALNQLTNACACNSGAALQAQRNVGAAEDLLDKLRKCPACGSANYKEEVVIYEKKK